MRSSVERISYKCKNHLSELKGDVGMSLHEKKGTRRTYTKQIAHPYIFVSRNGLLYMVLVVNGKTYYKIIVCF